MAFTGESIKTKVDVDLILDLGKETQFASMYLGDTDPRVLLVSPLYANLHGLPPLLIQVGCSLTDVFAIADGPAERVAGIQSTLQVGIGAVLHVEGALQVNARSVGAQALDLDRPPEAVEEEDRVAQFFDDQLDAAFVQAGAVSQVAGQLDFLDGVAQLDAGTVGCNCEKTVGYIYLF